MYGGTPWAVGGVGGGSWGVVSVCIRTHRFHTHTHIRTHTHTTHTYAHTQIRKHIRTPGSPSPHPRLHIISCCCLEDRTDEYNNNNNQPHSSSPLADLTPPCTTPLLIPPCPSLFLSCVLFFLLPSNRYAYPKNMVCRAESTPDCDGWIETINGQ